MREIIVFCALDILSIIHWYRTQTISKILVLLGFGLVFVILATGIFFYSLLFFKNLARYEMYGFLTATYMIHAGVLILFWLSVGSSIASYTTHLFIPSNKNDYLLTLPVKPSKLVWWFFIRSFFLNTILISFIILPVLLSFGIAFFSSTLFIFFLGALALILLLVLSSNSIGGLISYLIAPHLKGKGINAVFLFLLIFIAIAILLAKLIFPQELTLLNHAEANEFLKIYNRLPLSNTFLPTYWLVQLMTFGGQNYLFAILAFTLGVVLFSLDFQSRRYISLCQLLKVHKNILSIYKKYADRYLALTKLPIFYKDWLSIIRSPQEIGYGVFLLSLAFFFFLILSRAGNFGDMDKKANVDFVIFSFVWLLFFTTCYLLRLVFPLMAREGKSFWFMFTLPISINRIVWPKILLGLVLVIPHIFISIFMWFVLPFNKNIGMQALISAFSVLFLSLVNGFLGTIAPNFPQGSDPEKVSTSTMGIATLIVSIIITAVLSFTIYQFLNGVWPANLAIMITLGIGILIILPLNALSSYFSKRYEFK